MERLRDSSVKWVINEQGGAGVPGTESSLFYLGNHPGPDLEQPVPNLALHLEGF